MNQHEEFLEGFGDALGEDKEMAQAHYWEWVDERGLNITEVIDAESGGYLSGLEAGKWYREEHGI